MALSFKTQPSSSYLANNPIVFELKSNIQKLIHFDVLVSGNVVYTGMFMPVGPEGDFEANVDISDLVKSYMDKSEIENPDQLVSSVTNGFIQVSVQFKQNNSRINYSGRVYKGGVGKEMLRYLKAKNTDIFAYKFSNTDKQFFLTTRTSGRHIVLKENELLPLYFIATEKAYTVVTEYGKTFTFPAMTLGNVYTFNIEVLRNLSYNLYREIPSFLGILVDGIFVFDIVIKSATKAPNKYIISFLNSFAAYEKLEVTGRSISEPEFAEDNAFMIYDQSIDDYIEQNNRLAIREVMKADFGYKSLAEFLFMRDMLQSDKRYLIDSDENQREVRVSCENFSHDFFPTEPGSVQLTIRFVDNDRNYSPGIDESLPDFNFGEAIWRTGITNGYGFLYADSTLNTI